MFSSQMIWRRNAERYNLKGAICITCNTVYYPPKILCSICKGDKFIEHNMPRTGKIVTFTKVFVCADGFQNKVPYFLALIELDNGKRLISQIEDCDEEQIKIGTRVKKIFRIIHNQNTSSVISYGYKFTILEPKQ